MHDIFSLAGDGPTLCSSTVSAHPPEGGSDDSFGNWKPSACHGDQEPYDSRQATPARRHQGFAATPSSTQIERLRLLGLAAQLRAKQLVVIKAGVEFGKTSLAVAWEEQLQRSGHGVAWLALDADDEPSRFLFYMAHALRRACRGIGEGRSIRFRIFSWRRLRRWSPPRSMS